MLTAHFLAALNAKNLKLLMRNVLEPCNKQIQ